MINPQELLKSVFKKTENEDVENKKEHELNDNDRMKLINKKMEESFLIETYSNFLQKRELETGRCIKGYRIPLTEKHCKFYSQMACAA